MNAWNMALRGLRRSAIVGLVLGALYSSGGLIIDLMTIGLNQGTALAFLALLGMPAISGIAGLCTSLIRGLFEQR